MSRRKFKAKRNFDGKKDDHRQINVRVSDIPEVDKRESVKRKHCEDVVEVVECPDISVILTDDVPEDAILIEAEEVPPPPLMLRRIIKPGKFLRLNYIDILEKYQLEKE